MTTFLLAFLGCILFVIGIGLGNFLKKKMEIRASCGGPLKNPDCCVKKTESYTSSCQEEQI